MEKISPRLVLIDGNAILHRAYHALPPLSTSEGEPVNAVFGFISMLLKAIGDLKPDYLIVAFDRPKPTFREKIDASYQAQRPKMEENLVGQIALTHKVLKTMEIPVYEIDGFEADDVIGTLTKQASQSSKINEVIIVTGDRDLLQLVKRNIKIYVPITGLSKTVLYDEKSVAEKFGVKPEQIVDFKALTGDQSDNYSGVSGIGPKTARGLLENFGTLEKIYENLDKVKEGLKDKLTRGFKEAELAKKLALIVTDVPIRISFNDCRLKRLDTAKTKQLFARLEFRSLIRRLNPSSEQTKLF